MKLSWFQYVILGYVMIIYFLKTNIETKLFSFSLGSAIGTGLVIFLLMWLFNKFIAPHIKIKNNLLIKGWFVTKILISISIILWILYLFIIIYSYKIDTYIYVQPEDNFNKENMDVLIQNLEFRLDMYGLSMATVEEANEQPNRKQFLMLL
jgi:hypothetical protein